MSLTLWRNCSDVVILNGYDYYGKDLGQVENRIRILIVENHEGVRRELASTFGRSLNFQVVGGLETEDDVVGATLEQKANVVLLEPRGGGSSRGLELCRSIKKASPDTAVIFLTSYMDPTERRKAYCAGCLACLLKEVDSRALVERVRNLLR